MKNLFFTAILAVSTFFSFAQKATSQLNAAEAFLKSLDEKQLAKATFAFDSTERFNFFYTPVPRKGLTLKDMNAAQKTLALNLLHLSVSQAAEQKVLAIMQLEIVLKEIEESV